MIESSIENLFTEINNSNEYKEYINIVNILKENKEVNNLIEEIKTLEKKATKLEYEKNKKYIEIDKQIEEKTKVLNSNKEYQEYLSKLTIGSYNEYPILNKAKSSYFNITKFLNR